MVIPIKGNTSALKALVEKAKALPDKNSEAVDISGLTAADADVRSGKAFYGASGKSIGTAEEFSIAPVIIPGTHDVTYMTDGKFLVGNVTIRGDANLVARNIKSGTSIFGVTGNYVGSSSGGTDTSDATAEPSNVRDGKVFYGANGKQIGSMPDVSLEGGAIVYESGATADVKVNVETSGYIEAGAHTIGSVDVAFGMTITPSRGTLTIPTNNRWVIDDVVVEGDDNLVSGNIKSGVSIFGVAGSYKGDFEKTEIDLSSAVTTITAPYANLIIIDSAEGTIFSESASGRAWARRLICDSQSGAFAGQVYNVSNSVGTESVYGTLNTSVFGHYVSLQKQGDTASISGTASVTINDGDNLATADLTMEFKGKYNIYAM